MAGIDQCLKKEQKHSDLAAALAVGVMRLDDESNDKKWSVLDTVKGRSKVRDMVLSSSQEAPKFFSKRCACKCLDAMVAQNKTSRKMATCIQCDEERERNTMFLCGGCRIHQ